MAKDNARKIWTLGVIVSFTGLGMYFLGRWQEINLLEYAGVIVAIPGVLALTSVYTAARRKLFK